jgi:hypothetical protein
MEAQESRESFPLLSLAAEKDSAYGTKGHLCEG